MVAETPRPQRDGTGHFDLDVHSVQKPAKIPTEEMVNIVGVIEPCIVVRELIVREVCSLTQRS